MRRLIFVLIFLLPALGFGATNSDLDPKLDALVQGCLRQARRDRICDGLITLKMVGDDSIEAIKEYIDLGVYEYYMLTAANAALTGRIRVRFPIFRGKWQVILDSQRDATDLVFSRSF